MDDPVELIPLIAQTDYRVVYDKPTEAGYSATQFCVARPFGLIRGLRSTYKGESFFWWPLAGQWTAIPADTKRRERLADLLLA